MPDSQHLLDIESRYRAIFENAPNLIITVDKGYRIQDINRVLPGFDQSSVLGSDVFAYLPQDEHARIRKVLQGVFATGNPASYEVQAYGAHGAPAWYHVNVGPLVKNGSVQSIVLIASDITQRVLAEQALREASVITQQIIASSERGVVLLDGELRIMLWNSFMEELTGKRAKDVLGKHPDELFPLQAPKYRPLAQRALNGETLTHKDERVGPPLATRHARLSGLISPLKSSNGRINGVLIMLRDVTSERHSAR